MKLITALVKYIPVIINMWILLIVTGCISSSLYPFLGHSILFDILLFSASYYFRFCLWHKILISSMIISLILEYTQNSGFEISFINHLLFLNTLIAIILSTLLYYFYGRK